MESIQGRRSLFVDFSALRHRLEGYRKILVDIGTGDGRFVHSIARFDPEWFGIGIDTCRENLRGLSRLNLPNALYLISPAQALPVELQGLSTDITINFPWGSLLESRLGGDPSLLNGLSVIAGPLASLEIRLNAEALEQAGWSLEQGGECVLQVIASLGFRVQAPLALGAQELRLYPTTWAKRLAFGRDPRAVCLRGVRKR